MSFHTKNGVPLRVSGDAVYNPSGEHFGTVKGDRVYDLHGRYRGSIVNDRLIYRSIDSTIPSYSSGSFAGTGEASTDVVGVAAEWGAEPNIEP